ncbi:MAG: NAD(+)/NADH kinase [Chloroflexi bacterium]|nr:NAD(+)/NADH kinase [Chloroflexota bacterium]
MKRVGILYQTRTPEPETVAVGLADQARALGRDVWLQSSWDDGVDQINGDTDLIISVGGDGTLLRVARLVAPSGIPILGVNAGRLGFLTEIDASDATDLLPRALNGEGRIEERTMLAVEHDGASSYALNDAIISRGGPARTVQVGIAVNGAELLAFRGDGVVVATATGSTAYSLAAGGPVLPPTTAELIINPVSAHPASEAPVLVEPDAEIVIRIRTDHGAVLSLDGQDDFDVHDEAVVTVRRSPYHARLLRFSDPGYFYRNLSDLLNRRRRHPDLPDVDGANDEVAAPQGVHVS